MSLQLDSPPEVIPVHWGTFECLIKKFIRGRKMDLWTCNYCHEETQGLHSEDRLGHVHGTVPWAEGQPSSRKEQK